MSAGAPVGQVADLAGEGCCKSAPLLAYRKRHAAAPAVGALSCSAQIVAQLASAP